MSSVNLDHLLQTKKQKAFGYQFLEDTDKIEHWDQIVVGEDYESERTFTVEREDLLRFAEAVLDDNPLFHDEHAGKASPYGQLLPHPIFLMEIAFWCIGMGRGSWIRTPGSMNPGQRIVWYEPFRVGEVITMRQRSHDKWIRRGRHYVIYELNFFNEQGTKKATWWLTLILPKTAKDVLRFAQA